MKSFRQFLVSALLVTLVACSLIYTSCKNKCGSTTCQNGGTCTDNVCICPRGYSDNSCGTGWSDDVVGTYTCTRGSCSPYQAPIPSWQSTVTKDGTNGGYTLDIANFDNSNVTVYATVDSAIDSVQIIQVSGGGINGAGTNARGTVHVTKTGTTINLSFTTYDGVTGSNCSMTMVKEQ